MKTNTADCKSFVKILKAFLFTLILCAGLFASPASAQTVDFHQASNQDHPTTPIVWINGILNENNSEYFEGIGVPQRILFSGIDPLPGDTHAITFRHQVLKGGAHAYDFLMSWPQAISTAGAIGNGAVNELQNLMAQQCDANISPAGLDACTTATNVLAIVCPDNMGDPAGVSCGTPPFVSVNPVIACFEGIFGNRFIHVYGDQPVTWGELIFNGYDGLSDVYATYTLRWKSASTKIKILVAARASQSCTTAGCCGYGSGCGTGTIFGGPLHFKLEELDGQTLGSQDNQLVATAAPAPSGCDISGPSMVCPNSTGNVYTSTVSGTCTNIAHHWSVTGQGSIVGSTTSASVIVNANSCGTFTVCDTIFCEEASLVCCRTINVANITAPTLTCPASSNVECPNTPVFGEATATDGCGNNLVLTSTADTTFGPCPLIYSITRTWTAADDCGNTATCLRTFSVSDNSPPTLSCPPSSNVECPNTPAFGSATVSDDCNNVVLTSTADTTFGPCPQVYSIVRTWNASDNCGNSAFCTRTFSVSDNTPPVLSNCPAGGNLGCNPTIPACNNVTPPSASDICSPPAITCSDGAIIQAGNNYSRTITWTATDACGNTATCAATYSWTQNCGCAVINAVPGIANLINYLFVFTDGNDDVNWQGPSNGYVGNVAVDGVQAKEKTLGIVPYAGTISTNDATLSQWQQIVNSNAGQAFSSLNQTALISGLTTDLESAFSYINGLTVTPGFDNRSATSLNGLNTQNGVAQTIVINLISGFTVSTKINITGDATDVFILRWDTDKIFSNGYDGQVKFQNGGAIVPLGGLKVSNFIHVAGDITSGGGGTTPLPPYPQGPRYNDGTGALITGGTDFTGGGFFTGYWLTTGKPTIAPGGEQPYGKGSSLSNGIFVGGLYSKTTKINMTSGTSGVYVSCPQNGPRMEMATPPVQEKLNVFPNPATENATILFMAGQDAHAVMEVYSSNGAKVASLFNRDVHAGETVTVEFNTQSLARGIYLCKLELGGNVYTHKIVVNR